MAVKKIENKCLLEELFSLGTADVYMYDSNSGIEYMSKTIDTFEININSDKEEITSGRLGNVITVIKKGQKAEIKFADAEFKRDITAIKMGDKINTGSVKVTHIPNYYDVSGSGGNLTITLSKTPVEGEVVNVYKKDGTMIEASKVTLSTNKLTITDETLKAGDSVLVGGFEAEVSNAEYTKIGASDSASVVSVTLEQDLFDSNGNIKYVMQYIFPKCNIGGTVSISGQSEKTKKTSDSDLTPVYSPEHGCIGYIVYLPVDGIQA